jgi:hypothetical protein
MQYSLMVLHGLHVRQGMVDKSNMYSSSSYLCYGKSGSGLWAYVLQAAHLLGQHT